MIFVQDPVDDVLPDMPSAGDVAQAAGETAAEAAIDALEAQVDPLGIVVDKLVRQSRLTKNNN